MMANDYGYPAGSQLLSLLFQYSIPFIICAILAIAGGIVLYFLFMAPKNAGKYTGFLGWAYKFLNFEKLILEILLKVLYVITALFISLYSIYLLFAASFLTFLLTFVAGNLVWRILYEFMLMIVLICRNTSDINRKMKE